MQHKKSEVVSEIEKYINSYYDYEHRAPSVREIGLALQLSDSTVFRYLLYMDENGILEYRGRKNVLTVHMKKSRADMLSIPIVGSIACGSPKIAEESIEQYIHFPATMLPAGDYFFLKADGNSMINAGIHNGDLVLIRQQNTASAGDIVVALVDNENATLKRYQPAADKCYVNLIPENEAFPIQHIDVKKQHLIIQGVAVKVFKDLV